MTKRMHRNTRAGFSLVEMMISVLVLGVVLIAFAAVFMLFQKSSAQTNETAQMQQNARIALDFITNDLREAGVGTDYFRGQPVIDYAGPYQVAFNADVDNGQTIQGAGPLAAINIGVTPNKVPPTGTALYAPTSNYTGGAETEVFTLDSNKDGAIAGSDRGDDPEEIAGHNPNLFVLKKYVYGFDAAGNNEVRESNLALVRGPNLNPTWNVPQPLFAYYYDDDGNPATPDRLWGDTNGNGVLESAEVSALTAMPSNLLNNIRKIKVTTTAESNKYDRKYQTNGGFSQVALTSEVNVRNTRRMGSVIYGKVYLDANENGVLEPTETGLWKAQVSVAGTSRNVLTDNFGVYYLRLPAGTYSIQETDPAGYVSTTANVVSVTLTAGQSVVVNFGDKSTAAIGKIKGIVFDDQNKNGIRDGAETGIQGALISLDTGPQTLTAADGSYDFVLPRGNYTVVETDPTGYSSTTPNSRAVTIAAGSDTVTVNYGDFGGAISGTLQGYVFLDENLDGYRGGAEEGIPNAVIHVSNGDSTMTNSKGFYSFTLPPGSYDVVERDPVGYTSTTVNKYLNILITPDTTVTRNFGDILNNSQNFVEIVLAQTDRALSVAAADLGEDAKNDVDIVLGTALASGIGNMLIFQNKWESATTPVSELFSSTPTYRRDAGENINTLNKYDFNNDGVMDIMSGLDHDAGQNVQVWFTGSGGVLNTSPNFAYLTDGSNKVMDAKLADVNGDGVPDVVVGLKSSFGTYSGGIQVFTGSGNGSFTPGQYITKAGPSNVWDLGEVWAVDTGDINNDGRPDVVVGSHTNSYQGYIDVYQNNSGTLEWRSRYLVGGAVNDVKLIDMKEDDANDLDIVAGVSTGANTGRIVEWLNSAGTFGLPDTTGYSFPASITPRWPDDWLDAGGEPLCLASLNINNDVFPDIAYGTRSSSVYTGDIYVLACYGTMPPGGQKINSLNSGEAIAMDIADFNQDAKPDIVVGTRVNSTRGVLVVYFGSGQ
jgi:prepilin-type N-terminal cleavage/methylation domain-containing protein